MKFMEQDMFEVMVISFAKYSLLGSEEFSKFKHHMHNSFKNTYNGDVLWLKQAEELIFEINKLVVQIGAKDPFQYLTVASEFRQKLDVDLKPLSTTKKLFGGTFFQKSHPSPSSRKEIAIINFKRLMVMMAANGFVHN